MGAPHQEDLNRTKINRLQSLFTTGILRFLALLFTLVLKKIYDPIQEAPANDAIPRSRAMLNPNTKNDFISFTPDNNCH